MKRKIFIPILLIASIVCINTSVINSQDINDIGSIPEQVDLVTGTPIINIPLWDLHDGDISIPINVCYSATGIKAIQPASWVGLGWNLNAGGMITRSVHSLPDDAHPDQDPLINSYGWLFNDINDINISEKVTIFPNGSGEFQRMVAFEYFATEDLITRDQEPDVFYFNLPGLSGSFVFEAGPNSNDRQVKLIPYQNVQITYTLNGQNEISTFTIIDANGYHYIFGKYNTLIFRTVFN
jgi:hypothetical protein